MIIYLDTETTGLAPGRMFQLAYIMQGAKTIGKNFFFKIPDNSMTFAALMEHGVTEYRTKALSNGLEFKDHFPEIKADFEGKILVAHNMEFDKSFLDREIQITGVQELQNVKYFCSMKYFTPILKLPSVNPKYDYKYPKLRELIKEFKIKNEDALRLGKKFFPDYTGETTYHDARFDVSMLLLCCEKYSRDNRVLQNNKKDSIIEL